MSWGSVRGNLLWAVFLVLFHPAAIAQDSANVEAINRYMHQEMQRQHIPGISIGVLRGDRVLLARGYGFSNLEHRVPANDSTIYQSGSLGKQFTAAGVVMLAEQGRVSLDDKIIRWLPEGRGVWQDITVRHLLTHTSGLAEYTDSTFDYRKDYTEDQLVRFAAGRPLDFAPGTRWSYSNTGYLLLGVLVHRLTGRFYGDVLRNLIFAPLGMRTTRVISEAEIVPHRAAGYELVKGQIRNQSWVSPSLNTTADGALYFSVNDLIKWSVSLNQKRIPDPTVLKQAWSPTRLNDGGLYPYGFGWDLTPQRTHLRIGHTGAWQGFETVLYRYPEYDLTVIVLTNLAQAEPGAMAQGIAGILEPELRPPHLLPSALPGPRPPLALPDLLRRLARETDSTVVTRGLRRFLSPASRKDLRESMSPVKSWTSLGCEDLGSASTSWLGSTVKRACYARGTGREAPVTVSVFFTDDWQVAHYASQSY